MRHVRVICSLLLAGGIFLVPPSLFARSDSIMEAPKGWECINDPEQLPQKVKLIFVGTGSGKGQFTPSINLACEETSLPLSEYMAQAKAYHEGQSNTKCTQMGQLKTGSGTAEILQIDRPSQWGDIRFIQAVLVENAKAYVVTATCLKRDFGQLSSNIFKTIRSLNLALDD